MPYHHSLPFNPVSWCCVEMWILENHCYERIYQIRSLLSHIVPRVSKMIMIKVTCENQVDKKNYNTRTIFFAKDNNNFLLQKFSGTIRFNVQLEKMIPTIFYQVIELWKWFKKEVDLLFVKKNWSNSHL